MIKKRQGESLDMPKRNQIRDPGVVLSEIAGGGLGRHQGKLTQSSVNQFERLNHNIYIKHNQNNMGNSYT
jgi:hypothetical protein